MGMVWDHWFKLFLLTLERAVREAREVGGREWRAVNREISFSWTLCVRRLESSRVYVARSG